METADFLTPSLRLSAVPLLPNSDNQRMSQAKPISRGSENTTHLLMGEMENNVYPPLIHKSS